MDLIDNPEVKKVYDKCKYTVKNWEYKFKKKYGRLPSKLDIKEASNEVRYAYKKYFELKTAAIESTFQDVDAFDFEDESETNSSNDMSCMASGNESQEIVEENNGKTKLNTEQTWGAHLSISNSKKTKPEKKKVGTDSDVMTTLSQKLFNSSKLSKRNPRKSLSFVHSRNSESNDSNKESFLSQPNIVIQQPVEDVLQSDNPREEPLAINGLMNNIKILQGPEKRQCPSTSTSNNILETLMNNKPLKSVNTNNLDLGWMQRVIASAGPELLLNDNATDTLISPKEKPKTKVMMQKVDTDKEADYSSDDIVNNSEDDEQEKSRHSSKRRRLMNNFSGLARARSHSNIGTISDAKNSVIVQTEQTEEAVADNVPSKEATHQLGVNDEINKNNDVVTKRDRVDKKRSSRQRKSFVNLKECLLSSDEEPKDPFATEASDDSTYCLSVEEEDDQNKSKTKKKQNVKKNQAKALKDVTEVKKKSETDSYELEYSIKPRVTTVPRLKSVADVLKSSILEREIVKKSANVDAVDDVVDVARKKTKRELEKERFEKRAATGNLNENYVRINLKKKKFVRGKTQMNFGRYKRQKWKEKKKSLYGPDMDMGGCDGGTLLCFTCGEPGHLARYCNAHKQGDGLLPQSAVVEEEATAYPTLKEAAAMMMTTMDKSKLAVRKPRDARLLDSEATNEDGDEINDTDQEEVATDDDDEIELDSDDEMLLTETMKAEEQIANMNVEPYTDKFVPIDSYYPLNEDGSVIETPQEVFDVLKLFGHQTFRPGQETAIMRILCGKSTLVTLSTGCGKSLCYQLPAYLYAKRQTCITLVVSPLVSLMEDQVVDVPSILKACCLHTNQTTTQRDKIKRAVADGKVDVLLVSPEAVVAGEKSSGFGSFLRTLPPIAFACIDEAHCLSQWSHNFRPSYLMLCHILRERLGVRIVLGLTATATRSTCDSIIEHIRIADGSDGIVRDKPLPDNLRLTVSKDPNRDRALVELLTSEKFVDMRSIIVYCTRREECERLAAYLRTCLMRRDSLRETDADGGGTGKKRKRSRVDVQAEPYHAGMSSSRRRTIQKSFMSGQLKIVVATVAFGMGINKSDIRAVIHYNVPSSFESYVQEIGRAGRDGLPAHCHLFLDTRGNDANELQRHIHANWVDRSSIRKLLDKVFVKCACKVGDLCPRHEVAFSIKETVRVLDSPEEIIATLLCYLELHPERYVQVLSPAYTRCRITSYNGAAALRNAAKDCPLLTMALAMYRDKSSKTDNILEFPIVELASSIGWDSGICKYVLKNLEWVASSTQSKRSALSVRFDDLGFRLLAPGNLTDGQLDEALDALYERVIRQERTATRQLRALNDAVANAVEPSYKRCLSDEISEKELELKRRIRTYFNGDHDDEDDDSEGASSEASLTQADTDRIAADTRTLVTMYPDNAFTGKSVARIFFGIQSPNYPALVWGRCKFWRAHLGADFHAVLKIATKEILQMRQSS